MLECHEVRMSSTGTLDRLPRTRAQILFGQNDGYWPTYVLCPINFKASMIAKAAEVTIMLVGAR